MYIKMSSAIVCLYQLYDKSGCVRSDGRLVWSEWRSYYAKGSVAEVYTTDENSVWESTGADKAAGRSESQTDHNVDRKALQNEWLSSFVE